MIVNIRGTSGSGKSTLIREIMAMYAAKEHHYVDGRRQPLYYTMGHLDGDEELGMPKLAVLGHYETPCGGCDTITKQDDIFNLVRELHGQGFNVLFEGLLVSAEFNRTLKLHTDGLPFVVIMIDIPLQECVDSVNARRWAKHPDKPGVNPKNTEAKWKGTRSTYTKLEGHGLTLFKGNRADALCYAQQCLELD